MFSLQIANPPSFSYSQEIIDNISKNIFKCNKLSQNGILNIAFIEPESIQNLNKKYRNKDSVTDVLSFHYFDNFSNLSDEDLAGEIVLCEDLVISQGVEYGLGSEKEFYKLLIHSVLHILGYDHENDDEYKEMKQWEDLIWEKTFEN